MTDSLKPCPFCGGEAEEDARNVVVMCGDCGAMILRYAIEDAILDWNTRVGEEDEQTD